MEFRIIAHGSPEYRRVVDLRLRILRAPLGLQFSAAELAAESGQTHIAAYAGDSPEPVACLVLADARDGAFHLRQMAVAENARRGGLGSAIISFAEEHARGLGKKRIFCHARYYVVPFYEKLGYRMTGGAFEEVGLTHVRMEKEIQEISDFRFQSAD